MRAIGPTAPKFGPKQTRSSKPRDVGIGGGPPKGGGKNNRNIDTGEQGVEAATEGRGGKGGAASSAKSVGTNAKHAEVVGKQTLADNGPGAKVKGQADNNKGEVGVAHYSPSGNEFGKHGGHDGSLKHLGKHGRDSSVGGHEHTGYKHTSSDR